MRIVDELKRRRVVRVAVVYAATAFVVLQVGDLLVSGLALPAWVFTAITVVVLLGFPLALALAWAFELTPEGVQRTVSADGTATSEPWLTRRSLLALLVLALVLVGATWALRPAVQALSADREPAEPFPTAFELNVPDGFLLRSSRAPLLAISADGSTLAFAGVATASVGSVNHGIVVHPMDGFEYRKVRGAEYAISPGFSPDGRWLLVLNGTRLEKLPVGGGTRTTVTDTASFGGSWTEGGDILFSRVPMQSTGIWRVSAEGGNAMLLAAPDSARGHVAYTSPHALPGDRGALVNIWTTEPGLAGIRLGVVDLEDGVVHELGVHGFFAHYAESGHVVFARADGVLLAAPFSLRRRRLTGEPVVVLDAVAVRGSGIAEYALSRSGTLVYRTGSGVHYELVQVARDGSAQALTDQPREYVWPDLSPDGRRVVVTVANDVWVKDLVAGTLSRLTRDGASARAVWASGTEIAFVHEFGTAAHVRVVSADGGTAARELLPTRNVADVAIGPPGTHLALRLGYGGPRDIWLAPADSLDAARPLLTTNAIESAPRISGDGVLLAYVSDESGRPEVYVRRLPGPAGRIQVSTAGADEPVWGPDGRTLFYRTPTHLLSARIAVEPELTIGARDTVMIDPFERNEARANYDVFPDGRSFLMVRNVSGSVDLFVVVNWTQSLARRVGDGRSRAP